MKRIQSIVSGAVLAASVLGLAGCPADDGDGYGAVKLQFLPGEKDVNPYAGTRNVRVILGYRECVDAFYRNDPDMQQEGIEGAKVFERWKERLCTLGAGADQPIKCEVERFDQNMDVLESTTKSQLVVDYVVQEQNILDKVVVIGPLPTRDLTDCAEGEAAVRLQSATGFDGDGRKIWSPSTFKVREGFVDMGLPLKISAQRSGA